MLKVLMVLLNKKFNRREAISTAAKISVSTGLAAVAGGVVGYSAGSLTAPRDTIITRTVTQTVTGAPEKVELQVWDIETDPGPYDAMEKAIEVFETEYPNVTVKREAK
ncbi:MAG: hypothetical protein QXO86_07295, partial [Nitrososphaerota archaeon]